MVRRFNTLDVFTNLPLAGNPLAVSMARVRTGPCDGDRPADTPFGLVEAGIGYGA